MTRLRLPRTLQAECSQCGKQVTFTSPNELVLAASNLQRAIGNLDSMERDWPKIDFNYLREAIQDTLDILPLMDD